MIVPTPRVEQRERSPNPTVAMGKPSSRKTSSRGIDRQSLEYRAGAPVWHVGVPAVGVLVMFKSVRCRGCRASCSAPQSTVGGIPPIR